MLELDEDGFNKIPGGSTCVENYPDKFQTGETVDANEATNLANEDAGGKGVGAETGQFQSGEASDAVEATNLANEDASPSLLGDCRCAKHEIAQEISQTYTESLKAGYKKR